MFLNYQVTIRARQAAIPIAKIYSILYIFLTCLINHEKLHTKSHL